jgi:diguanylate cyclase (GGDEF)-like protein
MSYRSWPIKTKIMVINVATMVSALAAVFVFVLAGAYLLSRDRLLAEQRVQARVVAVTLAEAMRLTDRARIEETLAALRAAPYVTGAVLRAPSGATIVRFPSVVENDEVLPGVPDGEAAHAWDNLWLDVYEPIVAGKQVLGHVAIRASLKPLYASLGWYVWFAASVALLLAGIALLVQERLLRRVSQPLRRLAATMWRLSEMRDFNLRAQVDSDDEVGQLARGFNSMISNLQDRDTQLGEELKERKRAERRLHDLAHYDTLTGLPNRHYFNSNLARLLQEREAYGHPLALLFIDLDNFKFVNDSLGHAVGDKLIRGVGERLRRVLRDGDQIYRLGGDEFTLTLPNVRSREFAEQVARRILDALAQPFMLDKREVFANASIGIAIAPEDGRDAETLVRNADTAMYQAKGEGKSTYRFFNAEQNVHASRRLSIETTLRRALERGELELFGQPQIDLGASELVGVEVLLRWTHPDMGQLSPIEFIPIAEESGLILPIGEWILQSATREATSWDRFHMNHVRVAVNLSSRQFRDPKLVDLVKGALADTRLDPGRLELEITESTLMNSDKGTIEMMDELRSLGVQLAVDDFGTGYSSMSYLKQYPLSGIKIDQSFIRDIPGSRDDVAITRAIVAMGKSLDLGIVAEGVENERQFTFLSSLGGIVGQGHFFSRPVSFRGLSAVMQRWQRYALSELLVEDKVEPRAEVSQAAD